MTSRDFCYWLQGYFEMTDPEYLNNIQTATLKKHLALVFAHDIDPGMGSAEHQQELNTIHDPTGAVAMRC